MPRREQKGFYAGKEENLWEIQIRKEKNETEWLVTVSYCVLFWTSHIRLLWNEGAKSLGGELKKTCFCTTCLRVISSFNAYFMLQVLSWTYSTLEKINWLLKLLWCIIIGKTDFNSSPSRIWFRATNPTCNNGVSVLHPLEILRFCANGAYLGYIKMSRLSRHVTKKKNKTEHVLNKAALTTRDPSSCGSKSKKGEQTVTAGFRLERWWRDRGNPGRAWDRENETRQGECKRPVCVSRLWVLCGLFNSPLPPSATSPITGKA